MGQDVVASHFPSIALRKNADRAGLVRRALARLKGGKFLFSLGRGGLVAGCPHARVVLQGGVLAEVLHASVGADRWILRVGAIARQLVSGFVSHELSATVRFGRCSSQRQKVMGEENQTRFPGGARSRDYAHDYCIEGRAFSLSVVWAGSG